MKKLLLPLLIGTFVAPTLVSAAIVTTWYDVPLANGDFNTMALDPWVRTGTSGNNSAGLGEDGSYAVWSASGGTYGWFYQVIDYELTEGEYLKLEYDVKQAPGTGNDVVLLYTSSLTPNWTTATLTTAAGTNILRDNTALNLGNSNWGHKNIDNTSGSGATSAAEGQYLVVAFRSTSGTINWDNFSIQSSIQPVPEPSTFAFMGISAAILVGVTIQRRRKRK